MNLVSDGRSTYVWDAVMFQIARWTLRHLNDPRVLLWFAAQGGRIAPEFTRSISDAMKPSGVTVSPPMRILWSLLLAGRISSVRQGDVTLHQFRETALATRFPEDALTFLDTILGERSVMLPNDLNACLAEIRGQRPNLEHDPRFERLTRYAREVGG
jgi:hypothetical protein